MHQCASVCLWVALILVPPQQAKVTAPSHLQATLGLPFVLACNLTLENGDILKQVRWLDTHNATVLHYEPENAGRVRKQARVELVKQQVHSSAISVQDATPGDEGCYTCVFDIYPSGQQQAKTCIFLLAKVEAVGNRTAVQGKAVTFSCTYALVDKVLQVLWRKTEEQGDTAVVASYTKQGSVTVAPPFWGRGELLPSLKHSQLSIHPVQTEDEGCYTCEFHTYPLGSKSATSCLAVYVLPEPEVTSTHVRQGVVQANCTAVSRPPARLLWNVEGHNRTLGPSETSSEQQGDGTTLVVTSILLQSRLLEEEEVTCTALHQGLDATISVPFSKGSSARKSYVLLLLLACVLVSVLLVCLWVCLKRC
ncbi:OX-2 membrane glycoprotein [Brachyhypopomus gauderio]|uniref:OX-2 membrane glycoprotein n=1 Tax=Brachyhypopomus gauderio TaxID=698409 RepID=UPI004042B58E